MKLGPVTKLGKRNEATAKNMTISFRQVVTLMPFFRLMANLEQSGSRIPGAYSVKLTFSLIVLFCLIKTQTEKTDFLQCTQLLQNCLHGSEIRRIEIIRSNYRVNVKSQTFIESIFTLKLSERQRALCWKLSKVSVTAAGFEISTT